MEKYVFIIYDKYILWTRLVDNSAAEVILEKSWVHNYYMKSKYLIKKNII